MDTIFELFAAINTAIDAGVMTQEVVAFAALAISHRVLSDWNTGRIGVHQLHRVAQEMESLDQRWRAYRLRQPLDNRLHVPNPSAQRANWIPAIPFRAQLAQI